MWFCVGFQTQAGIAEMINKQISGVIERAGFLFCFVFFLRVVNTHFVVFKLPGSSFLARGRWCGRKMDGRLAGGV